MKRWLLFFLAASCVHAEEPVRIITAGGAITETVYALGAENSLVGTDSSSTFPEVAKKLPQIGYARALSAEGILSLNPKLVLLTTDAGPPAVIEQLRAAGIDVRQLTADHTPEAVATRTAEIAQALQREKQSAPLLADLERDLQTAQKSLTAVTTRPKVLFIYARGGGVMNVSGRDTAADSIIQLAGGTNAVTEYTGYKPLTAEGAVTTAPDVILITTSGLESAGGKEGLLTQPGLALTPAGRNRRIVSMDDLLLLGFGPRLGKAVLELYAQLHPTPSTAQR